jgi:hypothetical protein
MLKFLPHPDELLQSDLTLRTSNSVGRCTSEQPSGML